MTSFYASKRRFNYDFFDRILLIILPVTDCKFTNCIVWDTCSRGILEFQLRAMDSVKLLLLAVKILWLISYAKAKVNKRNNTVIFY